MRYMVVLLAIVGCSSKHEGVTASVHLPASARPGSSPAQVPKLAVAPAPSRRTIKLGGGYQDVRWGSSRNVVKAWLRGKGTLAEPTHYNDDKVHVRVRPTDGTEVEFRFRDDKLFEAELFPSFDHILTEEANRRDRKELIKLLEAKYGPSTPMPERAIGNEVLSTMVNGVKWSDGETEIRVQWLKEGSPTVLYSNIAKTQQVAKDAEAARKRQRDATQDALKQHLSAE